MNSVKLIYKRTKKSIVAIFVSASILVSEPFFTDFPFTVHATEPESYDLSSFNSGMSSDLYSSLSAEDANTLRQLQMMYDSGQLNSDYLQELFNSGQLSADQLQSLNNQKQVLTDQDKALLNQAGILSEQIEAAEKELAEKEGTVSGIMVRIDEVNGSIRRVANEINNHEEKIKELDDKMKSAENGIRTLENKRSDAKRGLFAIIAVIYESKNDFHIVNILLKSRSIADLFRREKYIEAIYNDLDEKTKEYMSAQEDLSKGLTELEDLKKEEEKEKEELDKSREKLDAEVQSLNGSLAFAQVEQDKATESLEALEKRMDELRDMEYGLLEGYDLENLTAANYEGVTTESEGTDYWYVDPVPYTEEDLLLLAGIINTEALPTSYPGMIAVGSVVMNRIESPKFPNTLAGVIYQKKQFSPAESGRLAACLAKGPDQVAIDAARDVLNGKRNVNYIGFHYAPYAEEHGITGVIIGDNLFHDDY